MTRWLLMRHAKSDWNQGLPDRERRLAPRGEADAPRMGQWILDQGIVPEVALVSPARRAQQTYQLAASTWPTAPETHTVDALYGGHTGDYLDALESVDRDAILVAHDPTMTDLVRHLAPDAPRTESGKTMPTGSVAVFEDRNLVALQWPKALPKTD